MLAVLPLLCSMSNYATRVSAHPCRASQGETRGELAVDIPRRARLNPSHLGWLCLTSRNRPWPNHLLSENLYCYLRFYFHPHPHGLV